MTSIKNILRLMMMAAVAVGMVSCQEEEEIDYSLSVIKDSQTPQNQLDKWLRQAIQH